MKKKEPKKKTGGRQYDETEFVKDKNKKNMGPSKEKPKYNNPKKWLSDADDDDNWQLRNENEISFRIYQSYFELSRVSFEANSKPI